jgi:hypothetical protein
MSGNAILMYVSGGLGSCLGVVVLLYNLVTALLFLREETEGTSSGLAKAAWALGLLAMFVWWMPCVGGVVAIAAIVVARVERGRIYRDESSLAGATPVRMGSVDGTVALLLQCLVFIGALSGVLAAWSG